MGQALSFCNGCETPRDCDSCTDLHNWIMEALEEKAELQAYRDTGLSPEDVRRLQVDWTSLIMTLDEMGGMPHLRDLLQAEKDGRLVVLPCKVGDAAYWVHNGVITDCRVNRIQLNRAGLFICLRSKVSHGAFSVRCIGKSVFFSRRDAEAALESGDG